MAEWDKVEIVNELGETVQAQAPVIISASRSTDIPAFYSDWLMERIDKGYVKWINPFNGVPLYVCFKNTRLFVFWSKNPAPILKHLDALDRSNVNYYFQFTLNDYDEEQYEPSVPRLEERIETFRRLSSRIGKDRVIWRMDPLILSSKLSVRDLLKKAEYIGNQLAEYTARLVFSFVDIGAYNKVQRNLAKKQLDLREFSAAEMSEFAIGLADLNKRWRLSLGTCAEAIDLAAYGIEHNRCIDDRLIIQCFAHDHSLMRFCGVPAIHQHDLFEDKHAQHKRKSLKDKGQREACGCIKSKDIGEYNSCPHLCVYCYANASATTALKNFEKHNPTSSSIRS